MTILDIFDEVSRQYDVDSSIIIGCLKRAIRDEFKFGEVIDTYSNGKLELYEIFFDKNNKEKRKRIKITQKRLNYVRDRLYKYILDTNIQDRLQIIRNSIPKNKVLRGKIISNNEYGLEISTKFGKAFAPVKLLNPNELKQNKYKEGNELNFHVHKLGIKKQKINLVLDRVSKVLTEHIIKEVLGEEYEIYFFQRMFGKRVKIYLDKEPSKEERELLSMSFDEKVRIKLM